MKCPICNESDVVRGQVTCPNGCDLVDFWDRQTGPAEVEEDDFDPLGIDGETAEAATRLETEERTTGSDEEQDSTPPGSNPGEAGVVGGAACPGCGHSVLSDETFCAECGEKLERQLKCGGDECDAFIQEGQKFCTSCGRPVAAPDIVAAKPQEDTPEAAPTTQPDMQPSTTQPDSARQEDLLPAWDSPSAVGGARLVALDEQGNPTSTFDIKTGENHVGAKSEGEQVRPDIDLGPLDPNCQVSRKHAVLRFEENRIWLQDLGSTNGTFVDEQRLGDQPVEVTGSSDIRFGVLRCRIQC